MSLHGRANWDQHYASGRTPWDTQITPPEVRNFWRYHTIAPGALAIDLGCGTGTNLQFLQSLGMQVLGVELSGRALSLASKKLSSHTSYCLCQADVCRLPFHDLAASYILDIGCLHTIPPHLRPDYAWGVINNLERGGYYHLFAFDRMQSEKSGASATDRGVLANEVEALFAPAMVITSLVYGRPSRSTCRWYLLRKQ